MTQPWQPTNCNFMRSPDKSTQLSPVSYRGVRVINCGFVLWGAIQTKMRFSQGGRRRPPLCRLPIEIPVHFGESAQTPHSVADDCAD